MSAVTGFYTHVEPELLARFRAEAKRRGVTQKRLLADALLMVIADGAQQERPQQMSITDGEALRKVS